MKPITHLIFFGAFLFFYLAVISEVYGDSSHQDNVVRFANIEKKKIAILQFLPLPLQPQGGYTKHERVFTGEYYSAAKEDDKEDLFIPENYREMIDNNLLVIRRLYGIDLEIVACLADIPEDADYVLFGIVREYSAGKQAVVSLSIYVLDGKACSGIQTRILSKTSKDSIAPQMNQPIHMLGHHGDDFHFQRTQLNHTTYLCLLDLFQWLDGEIAAYETKKH